MKNVKQLRDLKAQKFEEMEALTKAASAESRSLNADEKTSFETLKRELAGLDEDLVVAAEMERRALESIAYGAGTTQGFNQREERDIKDYSYVRAINSLVTDGKLSGLEAEMHQEAVLQYRDAGLDVKGNLLIPQNVAAIAGSSKRTVNVTGGSGGDQGGLTVATDTGSLIERMKAKLLVSGMGATMLDDLVGNVTFPKFIPNDVAVDKAETAAAAISSPTFGSVTLTPRRLPVQLQYSRQFLAQSSMAVNGVFIDDLAFQISSVRDLSSITAILAEAGIGSVVGGTDGLAPTWAHMVALETAVAAANADYGTLGYLTNPKVRGKLKVTPKFTSTGNPIWENDGTVNGYRAGVTTQVSSTLTKGTSTSVCSAIIFGNWKDLLMAQWGGVEFLIDPYTNASTGLVNIHASTFYDEAIRNAASFAAMKDALTA